MSRRGGAGPHCDECQPGSKRKADTCCQRIDGEIFNSRVPSGYEELQDFENSNHDNHNACREEPLSRVSKSKRKSEQDEGKCVLAVLTEI
jgi:hypothetical protein